MATTKMPSWNGRKTFITLSRRVFCARSGQFTQDLGGSRMHAQQAVEDVSFREFERRLPLLILHTHVGTSLHEEPGHVVQPEPCRPVKRGIAGRAYGVDVIAHLEAQSCRFYAFGFGD